jgi:hypothetical protein
VSVPLSIKDNPMEVQAGKAERSFPRLGAALDLPRDSRNFPGLTWKALALPIQREKPQKSEAPNFPSNLRIVGKVGTIPGKF